jgi:hypothetical protein
VPIEKGRGKGREREKRDFKELDHMIVKLTSPKPAESLKSSRLSGFRIPTSKESSFSLASLNDCMWPTHITEDNPL